MTQEQVKDLIIKCTSKCGLSGLWKLMECGYTLEINSQDSGIDVLENDLSIYDRDSQMIYSISFEDEPLMFETLSTVFGLSLEQIKN